MLNAAERDFKLIKENGEAGKARALLSCACCSTKCNFQTFNAAAVFTSK